MNHLLKEQIDFTKLEKSGAVKKVYVLDARADLGLEYLIFDIDGMYKLRPLKYHPRWIILFLYFIISSIVGFGIAVPAFKSNRYDIVAAILVFPIGGIILGFLIHYFEKQKILKLLKFRS